MLERVMIGAGSGPEKGYVLKTFASSWTVACWAERHTVRVSKSSNDAGTLRFVIGPPERWNPKDELRV
jgi:hypothetical protein